MDGRVIDMTIDEAIAKYKEITNTDANEYKLVMEYGATFKELNCSKHDKEIYNKAIDDFVKFANTMPAVEQEDGEYRPMWLEEMAEQLKRGVNNV